MYYDNGNYMQDLNYYNQNPVQNFGYNPYMMNNFQNQQFPMGMIQNNQNLRPMYPAIYRVICPVVSQVVNNSNIQYITEDSLNKMVDTVYNIVEGDINVSDNSRDLNSNSNTNTESTQSNTRNNSNSNVSTSANSNCGANRQNTLLKDLIRIMILNEIISRRQNQAMMMQNNMQNFNMNQQMF